VIFLVHNFSQGRPLSSHTLGRQKTLAAPPDGGGGGGRRRRVAICAGFVA
jgi:hypothetical protein